MWISLVKTRCRIKKFIDLKPFFREELNEDSYRKITPHNNREVVLLQVSFDLYFHLTTEFFFFFCQLAKEVKSWPYSFPASEDFPASDQRGTVTGSLLVRDR